MNKKLLAFLLFLYCFTSIFFPVFLFNKIIFVPLFLCSVVCLFLGRIKTLSPIVVILIFFYGFIVSSFSDADFRLATQMLLGSLTLMFSYAVMSLDIDMSTIVKRVGASFALVMAFFSLMVMFLPGNAISTSFLSFYTGNELGYYGERSFGALHLFMLHHRASPFLIVPLSLFFYSYLQGRRTDLLWVIIIFFAVYLSASRALMLMACLSIIGLYFVNKGWTVRFILLTLVLPLALFGMLFVVESTTIFSSEERSNGIKIGHITSFMSELNFGMLFFGEGLGKYFYSTGAGFSIPQTEITWMDSIRYFGVPLTVVLLLAILFPNRKICLGCREEVSIRFIMLVYLLVSLANPVLFNSFGFIVILWYWGCLLELSAGPKNIRAA